jgi:hypothetical protein
MIRTVHQSLSMLMLVLTVGCATLPQLAPVDVTESGWTTHRGQAVWKFGKRAPEIIGEIMVAVNDDGRLFAEFNKSLVTVATARTDEQQWVLDLPMFERTLSGRGAPSDRFAMFQFDEVLRGESPPGDWEYSVDGMDWRLANPRTGEYVEGYWEE